MIKLGDEQDRLWVDRWYTIGDLTLAQYRALTAWRDDGGGVKRQVHRTKPSKPRESTGDHMFELARIRHKKAFRRMKQINGNAAQACHRLCMMDDPDVMLNHVQIGASILYAEYCIAVL